MIATSPKRPLWQIHLSTAVVLMIVAAALLYLNIRAVSSQRIAAPIRIVMVGGKPMPDTLIQYGWPIHCVTSGHYDNDSPSYLIVESHRLLISVAVNIGILVAAAYACEYLIRRRSKP
jgi:hypothetical protein